MTIRSEFNLYVLCGWVSFAVGVIGIFVPLLPYVPFFLLASWCFAKGSPRLHSWILSHKYAGPAIRDWEEHRRISKRAKTLAVLSIVVSISYSVYMVKFFALKAMLVLIGVAVSLFILTRKST